MVNYLLRKRHHNPEGTLLVLENRVDPRRMKGNRDRKHGNGLLRQRKQPEKDLLNIPLLRMGKLSFVHLLQNLNRDSSIWGNSDSFLEKLQKSRIEVKVKECSK